MRTEFSKRLVRCFVALFALHTLLTLCALALLDAGSGVNDLYTACVPVYITVFGGYYGKAAVENAKKITTAAGSTDTTNG